MALLSKLVALGLVGLAASAIKKGDFDVKKDVMTEEEYVIMKDYHRILSNTIKKLPSDSFMYRVMENHFLKIGIELAVYELVKEREKAAEEYKPAPPPPPQD